MQLEGRRWQDSGTIKAKVNDLSQAQEKETARIDEHQCRDLSEWFVIFNVASGFISVVYVENHWLSALA
jgi:hypothetical protein